jgi:hypothetical protein
MNGLRWLGRMLRRYVANDDPLAEAANKVSLLLASDIPFFALYLMFLVGRRGFPSVISTIWFLPVWLALPPISRRHSLLSRILTVTAAVLDCVTCSLIIGWDSGTALFLIPCITLGSIAFHRTELRWQLLMTGLPFLAYFVLRFVHVAPPVHYGAREYYLLTVFNAFTVACLTASIGFLFAYARPTPHPAMRLSEQDD